MLVTGIGPATVHAASRGGPPDPARLLALDSYLRKVSAAIGIPGLAAVVVKDARIVHTVSVGVADQANTPVTPQTPFTLASTSKHFTALAVMQQVETGRIDLDAPVQRYLPWFAVADASAAARITVRELLTHTSGLPRPAAGEARLSGAQDAGDLEGLVRSLRGANLLSPPGAEFHYANANYDVLGLVVQVVSGEPLSDYLERHVFAPLGMSHSHATLATARTDGLATGFYHWFGAVWLPAPINLSRGAASCCAVYASAEDLGHDLIAQLDGGRYGAGQVLSQAGITSMHSPAVRTDEMHAYGFGWDIRPLWEALDPMAPATGVTFPLPALVEHNGSEPTGHSYEGFVPSESWGVALVVNANDQADESAFLTIDQSILRILSGTDPLPLISYAEPLAQNGKPLTVLLLLLELSSFGWWVRRLVRVRRLPGIIARRSVAIAFSLAFALDVLVAWLVLAWVPAHFDESVLTAFRGAPDFALSAAPALVLAVVWGPIRILLGLSVLLHEIRARHERVAAAAGVGNGDPATGAGAS